MTMKLGEMSLEEAARQMAGNWRRFDSFAWFRRDELADAERWAVLYTHHRDSGLLDCSNAAAIENALEPFTEGDDPDVIAEDHSHWAVGWIVGFAIRVYRNGDITAAFKVYHGLAEQLADYPILNEEDYSNREYEATLETIANSAWRLKEDYELPDGWEGEVYSWLSDNRQHAVENIDDQGGYPEVDDLRAAFDALEYRSFASQG